MVEYEYPDEFTEEEIMDAERQQDLQEEIYGDTTPSPAPKNDLYELFWRVVKTLDSSKVGNVTKEELGMLDISVRDCKRIALIAEQLKHETFAKFFKFQAEIMLATGLSREGWLPELFVSQKKMQSRARTARIIPPQQPRTKKGLFAKK